MAGIRAKSLDGFLWVGSIKFLQQGISWLITIILARLLAPSDYGLMAMANLIVYFMNYFNELSLGSAIVQRKEVDGNYLSSAFWFVLSMSLLLYASVSLAAGPIAGIFGQPRLAEILRVLGLNFVLYAFLLIPHSMITRELQFQKLARADLYAALVGAVTSLSLAYSGHGVWSLVYGFLAKYVTNVVLLHWFRPWRPRLRFAPAELADLLRFGVPLMGSKMLSYFSTNIDNFVVGKLLGEKALGYYYMAYHLATMPVEKLSLIIYQVSFPLSARLQDDRRESGGYFVAVTRYVLIVLVPVLGLLAIAADDFVRLVLGEKWLPIVLPLQLFCIVGLVRAVSVTVAPVLAGIGEVSLFLRYNVVVTVLLLIGFVIGARGGILGVVSAWLAVYPLLSAALILLVLRRLGVKAGTYARRALLPAAAAGAVMTACVLAFRRWGGLDLGFVKFGASVLLGVVVYVAYLVAAHPDTVAELKGALLTRLGRKPRAAEGVAPAQPGAPRGEDE